MMDFFFPTYYIFHSVFFSYNHIFLGWHFHGVFKSHGEFCYLIKCCAGPATDGRQMSTTWATLFMLREKFLL